MVKRIPHVHLPFAFEHVLWQGDYAIRPLERQITRLPLSRVVAGMSLPPTRKGQAVVVKQLKRQQRHFPRFSLKDFDSLRAEARVESYAASACPDAPAGASNGDI